MQMGIDNQQQIPFTLSQNI